MGSCPYLLTIYELGIDKLQTIRYYETENLTNCSQTFYAAFINWYILFGHIRRIVYVNVRHFTPSYQA